MKVSAKTEYACIAMLELGASSRVGRASAHSQDCRRSRRSVAFLVQILLQFKGAGHVISSAEPSGGYELIKPPDEISLWK